MCQENQRPAKTGKERQVNRKGFTLIDMLIVIVVIAILALIVIPRLLEAGRRAKAAANAEQPRPVIELAYDRQIDLTGGYVQIPAKGDTTTPIVLVCNAIAFPDRPGERIGMGVVRAMQYWGTDRVGSVTVSKDPSYRKYKRPYWIITIQHSDIIKK